MPEIRVKGSEKAILCENGANLLQTLLKEGFLWTIHATETEHVESVKSESFPETSLASGFPAW